MPRTNAATYPAAQPSISILRRLPASLFGLLLGLYALPSLAATHEESRLPQALAAFPESAGAFSSMAAEFAAQWQQAEDAQTTLTLARQYGHQLWQAAKARLRARDDTDDRPLYWGRLAMTQAVRDIAPAFPLFDGDRLAALQALEWASRGMDDIQFPADPNVTRILVTGFDPFLLDRHLDQSNPAGVNALALDGEDLPYVDQHGQHRIAHIETAIFPVRYADFDAGIVEDFLRPWMAGSGAVPHDWLDARRERLSGNLVNGTTAHPQVDMIVTVSMGRSDFDLERFPGLRRSATAPDNLGIVAGGTRQDPIQPRLHNRPLDGGEFVQFSLPVAAMQQIQQPYAVHDNRWVRVAPDTPLAAGGLEALFRKTAVEGSGGGYLSNEISYRSVRLRDVLGVNTLPVGHLHTPAVPGFAPDKVKVIVGEIRAILTAGATGLAK